MNPLLDEAERRALRTTLLEWYREAGRTLPWRSNPTPYRVWVSEIMCQQTQIATVLPYFDTWMDRFPSPSALASADLDEVLAVWAGLGYYSRARNLHKAAQLLCEQWDGALPATHGDLLTLPGVGRYTAGAIASIAFDEPAPVVDGNVVRVLTRVFGLDGDPTRNPVKKTLWQLAEQLVPSETPGDFNQALMELGALVCRPRQPDCDNCALNARCVAYGENRVDTLPTPRKKPRRHRVIAAGLAVRRDDAVLLVRRKPSGLLGGLWSMPWLELVRRPLTGTPQRDGDLFGDEVAGKLGRWANSELGLKLTAERPLSPIDHTFTHIDYTLVPWLCALEKTTGEPRVPSQADEVRWVAPEGLETLGLPRMMEKALAKL